MDEIISESALEQKFRLFDLTHLDWSASKYKEYAILQMDSKSLRSLLIEDIKYRKSHGLNVVASCDGWQGKGKSLFMSSFARIVGQIYEHPFPEDASNVYYSPIEFDARLESGDIEGETFLRDEHRYSNHGEGSRIILENLSDYEEQLRITQTNLLFASVKAQDHAHFFWFEAKQTNFSPTEKTAEGKPKPISVTAVLKTPLYTDKNFFVWRGLVTLPVPDMDYLRAYDLRKREYTQKDLRDKGDNALSQIKPYAEKVLTSREEDLIKTTRDGFISPQKEELIKLVVTETIGSRKFTVSGYKSLNAYIQNEIKKKFAEHNERIIEDLEAKKQAQFEKRVELMKEKESDAEKRRTKKQELQKLKLQLEREKLKLKKERYEMMKKGLLDGKKDKGDKNENVELGKNNN